MKITLREEQQNRRAHRDLANLKRLVRLALRELDAIACLLDAEDTRRLRRAREDLARVLRGG